MAPRKQQEYAHVLAGVNNGMAHFQLVFEDGSPVDEFRIPVSDLDRQRPVVCDAFLKEMKQHGIRGPEQYRFVDETLRTFKRGKHQTGYGTANVPGLGDIQRIKYESYLRTGFGGNQSA